MNWKNILFHIGFGAVLFLLVGVLLIGVGLSLVVTVEEITVKGDVIDVIIHDDYMTIIMDNGNSYNVRYPGDNIDLTKGSSIIMKLTKFNLFFIDDGIWNKINIIKIP